MYNCTSYIHYYTDVVLILLHPTLEVVVDETIHSDNHTSSSSSSVIVDKHFRPATAIDIKEPLRGKLLAICRRCKEAFSSLPPAASPSSSLSEGTGNWCGVGKVSTIPSDLGYDPDATVSVVFPWQLFADNHKNNDDYIYINDGSNTGAAAAAVRVTGDGSSDVDAVPIAIAMARSVAKGFQGEGLSCQLSAG